MSDRLRLMLNSAILELERIAVAYGDGHATDVASGLREELRQMDQPPLPTILEGQTDIYEALT